MPVEPNYSVPPWLHSGDPFRAIEAGASLGQRINESNQRAAAEYMAMQQRHAQFQQQMEMQQQQLEQAQAFQQQHFQAQQETQKENELQKQQQLMVENAYKQAQIGLGKQKLEMTTQAAAKKFQTQQLLQSEINSDTQSMVAEEGMDPDEARQKATVRAYMRHATDLGLNPAAISQLAKSSTDPSTNEGSWRTHNGQDYYVNPKTGAPHFVPKAVPTPQWQEDDLTIKDLNKTIQGSQKELQAALADKSTKSGDLYPIQQRLIQAQAERHQILQKRAAPPDTAPVSTGEPTVAPPASPAAAAAMPQPIPVTGLKKEDLQDGIPYITAKGVAIWNKDIEKFTPVPDTAAPSPDLVSPEHPADEP